MSETNLEMFNRTLEAAQLKSENAELAADLRATMAREEKAHAEIERLQAALKETEAEHEQMRQTLEIISGNAADGLQRLQARAALTNIGAHSGSAHRR